MQHADLIAAAGDGFALVIVDVGSLGGLHVRWRPFRSVVAGVLFDPREDLQAVDAPAPGRDFICRTALGESEGEATLFVTRRHTMTSTLRPDPVLMPRFLGKAAHTEIVSDETLKVRPFDAVAGEAGLRPDVLKIDIQGGELGVLKGAAGSLEDSVIFVEAEVSFFERYLGQPVFRDIEAFLAGFGFEFIDFYRMKRYRHVNAARIDILRLGRRQQAGRLAFADAFFLLREEVAAKRMAALSQSERASFVLKTVMILVAYGKADLAARWYDLFGGAMTQSARDHIAKAFRRIRRRRFGPGYLHRLFDYVDRRI